MISLAEALVNHIEEGLGSPLPPSKRCDAIEDMQNAISLDQIYFITRNDNVIGFFTYFLKSR